MKEYGVGSWRLLFSSSPLLLFSSSSPLYTLFRSAVAEAAGAAFSFRQGLHGRNFLPLYLLESGHHHLGNALAMLNCERFLRQVNQQDFDLATVISVDGTGAVKDGNAVFHGQSAARADLRLAVGGKFYEEARRHEHPLTGLQHHILLQVGTEIHARGALGRIRGKGIIRGIVNFALSIFHIREFLRAAKVQKNVSLRTFSLTNKYHKI